MLGNVFKFVTFCSSSMWLCICPSEQEASYLNNAPALKFCGSRVNGVLLLRHGESRVCSQGSGTSGLAGLQVLHMFSFA